MKISLFKIPLAILLGTIFFSCGKESLDTVSGKYILNEMEFHKCEGHSITDIIFSESDQGLCATVDNIEGCFDISLTFDESSLTSSIMAFEDGENIINNSNTTSFDPSSGKIDFCFNNGNCEDVIISEDFRTLTFFGSDSDLGCDFILIFEHE